MAEGDIDKLLMWEHTNVCSDGSASGRHPRGYGAFTRILKIYVREKNLLPIELAVHKMTGLSADHLGLKRRGYIKQGFYADLVLFDKSTVGDRSTTAEPQATSEGILGVWVNGKPVYSVQGATGNLPGRVIRRGDL